LVAKTDTNERGRIVLAEWDYRCLFAYGILHIVTGSILLLMNPTAVGSVHTATWGILSLTVFTFGLITFLASIFNVEKWKGTDPLTFTSRKMIVLLIALFVVLVVTLLLGYFHVYSAAPR